MGAKGKSKYQDIEVGASYGDWIVVGEVYMDRYAKVPCKCKCGKEAVVDAYTLVAGKSQKCKTCGISQGIADHNPAWRGYEKIPASWFTRFRNYAKKKGNSFEIQPKDIWELFEKQNRKCALSGIDLSFVNQKSYRNASYTVSIDRIDSNKGYTKDNTQLVHKDINIMKNAFNQNYFVQMCKLITQHNV
jgi:hypothetical protein